MTEATLRVCLVHRDLPPLAGGGVPHQVLRLARALSERGHLVTIKTLSPPSAEEAFSVERLPFGVMWRSELFILIIFPWIVATRRYRSYDIVHVHGNSEWLFRRRTPVIRTFYGTAKQETRHATRFRRRLSQRFVSMCEWVALSAADYTVAISGGAAKALGRVDRVIPCGVDLSTFHPGPKSTVPAILFVGTLGGRKRGQVLVDAFVRDVLPRLPSCELWLVSPEAATGPNVRWLGKVSDPALASLYRRAWIFCLPSTYEGFGVPYIEAMASGTVVVATPNEGALEVLTHESGGVISSEDQLGLVLARLLSDSKDRRDRQDLGLLFVRRFEWSSIVTQYEEAYAAATSRR